MSGPGPDDPREPIEDPAQPGGGPDWPAHDLDDEPASEADGADAASPDPDSPEPVPVPGVDQPWDTRRWGERRRPTTAEQAVPWLIGLILALAGIVIVLLALIFTDANGGFAPVGDASLATGPSGSVLASPSPVASPSSSPRPSASATPAPTPPPKYGALDMLYLARLNGTGVSRLFRDDFATTAAARVVASPGSDISHYAIAPDGTVAAGIASGRLLALVPGKPARTLESSAAAVTFGSDAHTVYAVTITRGAATDQATVDAIGFADGKARKLAVISLGHPAAASLSELASAAFFDDGGSYRLYATSDGNLVLWVANAGQWRIDPISGAEVPVTRQPTLWSPEGSHRIQITTTGGVTTISVLDQSAATKARVSVTGLVSHLRWSPTGNRVVFTLGIDLSGGGIRQDLYLWDLANGKAPVALTAGGASFGAEWLGVAQFWQP
ncbi:MAG TPA: hypothetical protein VKU35_06450 [Candidatus Limnocylindria bacterium]|nr:hypothetical protein [Candidatus Limnocylindria bacterium]